MKTIYFFIICSFIVFSAFAQLAVDRNVSPDSTFTKTQPVAFHKKYSAIPFADRMHLSLEAGAFYASFGKENMFNTWIAPELKYSLTPRLSIAGGVMAVHSNLNNLGSSLNNESINSKLAGSNQYYLFARGEYLLTDNIRITATTMQSLQNKTINASPLNYNSIGLDVKVTDHLTIGAGMVYSKGENSFGMPINNPFYHQSSPFYNNNMVGW